MDVWRLVVEGSATLTDLKTTWSYDDMQRAVAVLNLKSSIETTINKIMKTRMGNPAKP